MTARTIANQLLESDEDFDVSGEIARLTHIPSTDYDIESEGNHWNVYKKRATPSHQASNNTPMGRDGLHDFIGEITYDDMADMPKSTMTPEQIAHWDKHRWLAVAGFRENEQKYCTSFDEAFQFIVKTRTAKTTPPIQKKLDRVELDQLYSDVCQELFDTRDTGSLSDEDYRALDVEVNRRRERLRRPQEALDPDTPENYLPHVSSGIARRRQQRERAKIDHWLRDTTEPFDQFTWDGNELIIYLDGKEVERYDYDTVRSQILRESDDPDDPMPYVKPEQFTGQPSEEKIEGSLRRMLSPYYPDVRINKRPGLFHELRGRVGSSIKDSYIWTIHCNRTDPLPLPKGISMYHGMRMQTSVDWRTQVKQWFLDWAQQHNLGIYNFEIHGRLRKDPTFQFHTARLGPLKESEDDDVLTPEQYLAHYVDKMDVSNEIVIALWNWHPYGVSYNAVITPRFGFVFANLYFPPEKDDFYRRFEEFVTNWIKERKLFPVTSTKLTGGQNVKDISYPRWHLALSINSEWPEGTPPYVPTPVEVGKPAV